MSTATKLHSLSRVFAEGSQQQLVRGASITLDERASHHVSAVLRHRPGDHLRVFNEANGEWLARIAGQSNQRLRSQGVTVSAVELLREPVMAAKFCEQPWLFYSPLKPARMSWMVEKATELGAGTLWPIATDRCQNIRELVPPPDSLAAFVEGDDACRLCRAALTVVHARGDGGGKALAQSTADEKLRAWTIGAAEQSERLSIPLLPLLLTLPELLGAWVRGTQFLSISPAISTSTNSAFASKSESALQGLSDALDGYGCSVPALCAGDGQTGNFSASPPASTMRPRLLLVCDEAQSGVRDGASHANGRTITSTVAEWRARIAPVTSGSNNISCVSLPPLIAVLVGPEGGWSPQEREAIQAAESKSYPALPRRSGNSAANSGSSPPLHPIRAVARVGLGTWTSVLRAETAALTALALVQEAMHMVAQQPRAGNS